MEKSNHGHLEEVGYDTYCRLLDEVVKEEQGLDIKEDIDCQIDLNVTSYIPDSYISDSNQKIEVYQDIALCKNEQDISNVVDELIDRFGNMPDEIENLLEISRIKSLAREKNMVKIQGKKDAVVFTYDGENFDESIISEMISKYGNKIKFSSGIKPMVTLKIDNMRRKAIIKTSKRIFKIALYKKKKCDIFITKYGKLRRLVCGRTS